MKIEIQAFFAGIVKKLGIDNAVIVVTVPENPQHGDYTTNVAMLLAGRLKAPPVKIAHQIIDQIQTDQKNSPIPWLDRVEVAPPGFINLYVSKASLSNELRRVLAEKERYGETRYTSITHSDTGEFEQKSSPIKREQNRKKNDSISDTKNGQEFDNNSVSEKKSAEKDTELSDQSFGNTSLGRGNNKKIMVEFAHPNTHKAFHIGHLRNITTGESVVRLLESQGHTVIRANYQGDVGMHIAKALYALLNVSPFKDEVHTVMGVKNRVEFLGKAYAAGSKAFEEDEKAKERIKDFNYFVYASAERFAAERGLPKPTTDYLAFVEGDRTIVDTVFALWKETRQWSLDYFDSVYTRVSTHYDRFYFESECLGGVDRARDAVKKGVLKESDGAVIFDGKPHKLDTRVFVNSLGLPTYEAKELALSAMESTEFGDLDRIIHCVGPEQASFFKVTFKAEELLGIVKPDVQYHLAYGWVKLKEGKMSSRLGNVVLGEWLIEEVKKEVLSIIETTNKQQDIDKDAVSEALAIGAIKYAFLKVSTNQEIAFDLKESINTNGDSGPYLMYTYARCQSVLRKAGNTSDLRLDTRKKEAQSLFGSEERLVARMILQFPDVVADAATRLTPNVLCTYLFQLAQQFNVLYAKEPIIGNDLRVALTAATAQVLKNGLYLLGINVLERM